MLSSKMSMLAAMVGAGTIKKGVLEATYLTHLERTNVNIDDPPYVLDTLPCNMVLPAFGTGNRRSLFDLCIDLCRATSALGQEEVADDYNLALSSLCGIYPSTEETVRTDAILSDATIKPSLAVVKKLPFGALDCARGCYENDSCIFWQYQPYYDAPDSVLCWTLTGEDFKSVPLWNSAPFDKFDPAVKVLQCDSHSTSFAEELARNWGSFYEEVRKTSAVSSFMDYSKGRDNCELFYPSHESTTETPEVLPTGKSFSEYLSSSDRCNMVIRSNFDEMHFGTLSDVAQCYLNCHSPETAPTFKEWCTTGEAVLNSPFYSQNFLQIAIPFAVEELQSEPLDITPVECQLRCLVSAECYYWQYAPFENKTDPKTKYLCTLFTESDFKRYADPTYRLTDHAPGVTRVVCNGVDTNIFEGLDALFRDPLYQYQARLSGFKKPGTDICALTPTTTSTSTRTTSTTTTTTKSATTTTSTSTTQRVTTTAVEPSIDPTPHANFLCKNILISTTSDWTDDCKSKCDIYGPGGYYHAAYCPEVDDFGLDLAYCVMKQAPYCRIDDSAQGSIVEAACRAKITSSTPDYYGECVSKCDLYGPNGTYRDFCPNVGTNVETLLQCIISQNPYCSERA